MRSHARRERRDQGEREENEDRMVEFSSILSPLCGCALLRARESTVKVRIENEGENDVEEAVRVRSLHVTEKA